ncbi:MAG: hypothetical protein ACRDIC_14145, partial [bacterium]
GRSLWNARGRSHKNPSWNTPGCATVASTLATIAAIAVLLLVVPFGGPAGTAHLDVAAAAMPAVHWTFDGGPEGWRAVFGPGQVRSTVIKEHVRIGSGALESSYTIAPHTYFAVARPVTVPDQPAITLSFWIKSMKTERLAIYLTERDGSGYSHLHVDDFRIAP